MNSYTSGELTAIMISAIVALVVARRSYSLTRGVPYSAARLIALPALVLVLWGASEAESVLLTPWALPYLLVLDVAILVLATLTFTRVAERRTEVYRDAAGGWMYRIGFSLAGLFLGVYVVRLALAIVLFPSSLEFGAPPGGYPPQPQQVVLGVIDALFSLSVGLLLGRSLGSARKYKLERGRLPPT